MFRVETALELNRLRNKQTTASLVVAPAVAAGAAKSFTKLVAKKGVKKTAKAGFKMKKKAMIEKARKKVKEKAIEKGKELATGAPKQEKVEFSQSARMGYQILIFFNIIADILDLSIFIFGVGIIISMIVDVIILPFNIYFAGIGPKNKKISKSPLWQIIKKTGFDIIPIIELWPHRTFRVYKIYKARIKAAEEGITTQI